MLKAIEHFFSCFLRRIKSRMFNKIDPNFKLLHSIPIVLTNQCWFFLLEIVASFIANLCSLGHTISCKRGVSNWICKITLLFSLYCWQIILQIKQCLTIDPSVNSRLTFVLWGIKLFYYFITDWYHNPAYWLGQAKTKLPENYMQVRCYPCALMPL